MRSDVAMVVIAILALAVIVLGYLYYQERQTTLRLKVDVPGVSIETK